MSAKITPTQVLNTNTAITTHEQFNFKAYSAYCHVTGLDVENYRTRASAAKALREHRKAWITEAANSASPTDREWASRVGWELAARWTADQQRAAS